MDDEVIDQPLDEDIDDSFDETIDDYPCDICPSADFCDGWEAHYCCKLCEYYGIEHCEDCDPMDI